MAFRYFGSKDTSVIAFHPVTLAFILGGTIPRFTDSADENMDRGLIVSIELVKYYKCDILVQQKSFNVLDKILS